MQNCLRDENTEKEHLGQRISFVLSFSRLTRKEQTLIWSGAFLQIYLGMLHKSSILCTTHALFFREREIKKIININTHKENISFFPSFFYIFIFFMFSFFFFSKHIFLRQRKKNTQKNLWILWPYRNISVQNMYNLCNGWAQNVHTWTDFSTIFCSCTFIEHGVWNRRKTKSDGFWRSPNQQTNFIYECSNERTCFWCWQCIVFGY